MPKPAQKTSPARSARPAKAKPGAKPGAKPKAKVQRKAKAVSVAGVKADAGLPVDRVSVGDCLEHMAAWPEDSVDLVFADPPYNIGWQYDQYRDKRPGDEYVQWTEDWITAVARVLKPTGSFYLLIGDEYAAEARMHLKKLERDKQLQFRNWVIWHYTFGQNCKTKFNRSHAHLFYCVGSAACSHKGKAADAPYTFNRQAIAVPSARQTTYADARANPAGKMPDDLWLLRPQEGMAVQPEAIEEPSRPSKKRSGLRKNVNGASSDRSEGSAGLGADGDSGASGDFGGGFRGY
ncbi:MAG: site-specific DNA-methyltransferase, partial [Planctomycetota bacterium]